MGLVVTVTANAALDRTLYVDELHIGRRQRVQSEFAQAGGKGVNVSRVLAGLGIPVRTLVVVGGETGRMIERDLQASGLAPVGISAVGESRTCLEVLEARNGRLTQLHGAGVHATEETAAALLSAVTASLDGASWLALCGSLPDGCPEDLYARIMECARRRGVRVALDTSGPALAAGWRAAPDLLRINREEAAAALGIPAETKFTLPPGNAPGEPLLSVVSDGARSVRAWSTGGLVWQVTPPPVRERNALGCGDAMLAGLLTKLDTGPVDEALRFATALAAASATSDRAGCADAELASALAAAVSITTTR